MYDKLVYGSYTAATKYLGRAHRTQNADKRHHTFSNLVLRVKLRKAVRFVCDQETGGVMQPDKLASEKMGVMDETAASVLAGKHLHDPPPVLHRRCTTKRLFLFPLKLRRMWTNRSRRNYWGFRSLEINTQNLYRGGF